MDGWMDGALAGADSLWRKDAKLPFEIRAINLYSLFILFLAILYSF
jgi:hypothetical protein